MARRQITKDRSIELEAVIMTYTHHPNRYYPSKEVELTLGALYEVSTTSAPLKTCRFIQTSSKGFCLLNTKTHRCISRPLYRKDSARLPLPSKKDKKFTIMVPQWISVLRRL